MQITQLTNGVLLTSQFTYDGFGRRVKDVELNNGVVTSTKNFVWSGRRLCEERDASDNVTKRFLGEGEQINGTSYYFTFDHLGSVREMTDGSGAIRARYDYDPYGRRTKLQGDLDADFGFTGYYVHQPSGLQFALYRAYDADLGRFINRDPMGERGGLNLYRYVANSPINYYDPLGLSLSSFMNWLIPGWNDLYPDPSQSGSEDNVGRSSSSGPPNHSLTVVPRRFRNRTESHGLRPGFARLLMLCGTRNPLALPWPLSGRPTG